MFILLSKIIAIPNTIQWSDQSDRGAIKINIFFDFYYSTIRKTAGIHHVDVVKYAQENLN